MKQEVLTYSPKETYNILKDLIESNDKIIAGGGIPVAASLVGEPGIGKTTVIRELVSDLKRDFFKLNLSQLTEPAELVGFYQKQNEVSKDNVSEWITENLIPSYIENGFIYTGKTRTIPCPPDWVVNMKENGILLLDDYSRSNQLFSQAIMELINENTMIGWDLKHKKIQVMLSENPDNGEFNVSSQDKAQVDRMVRINMVWDSKSWAERAEKIGTDERLINFVLFEPEFFENKKQDGISASGNISPRMMDKFFSLVSTIDDFDKHLDKVSTFGSISVGKEVVAHFNKFLKQRLDKLPSVEKLLLEYDLPVAKKMLTDCCGDFEKDGNNWKGASAAILSTRFFNYVRLYNNKFKKDDIKKYLELLLHSAFSIDQKFIMVRNTVNCGNQFAQILAGDPRFMRYMTT